MIPSTVTLVYSLSFLPRLPEHRRLVAVHPDPEAVDAKLLAPLQVPLAAIGGAVPAANRIRLRHQHTIGWVAGRRVLRSRTNSESQSRKRALMYRMSWKASKK